MRAAVWSGQRVATCFIRHLLDVIPFLPCLVCFLRIYYIYIYTLRGFYELTLRLGPSYQ